MIDIDFGTIERSLGIKLPAAYRRLMLAYPFSDDRPSDAYIPNSAEYVCSLNQQIVADGVYPMRWRPGLFAIGTTWGGDAHVLDTSLDDSPVYKFHQDNEVVTTLAATLDDWVRSLSDWYTRFDGSAVASEYKQVADTIHNAGFFTTSPEPMDGWHRITVSSLRRGGNSFWVARIKCTWIVGAWGGNIYRMSDNVTEFCVAWLTHAPERTYPDFSKSIQDDYNLEFVSNDEFDNVVRG